MNVLGLKDQILWKFDCYSMEFEAVEHGEARGSMLRHRTEVDHVLLRDAWDCMGLYGAEDGVAKNISKASKWLRLLAKAACLGNDTLTQDLKAFFDPIDNAIL
jgi:hypothetical protein